MEKFMGTDGPWEVMMDDDEIKVIQSGSLENGYGWRSYTAICEEVQCSEDANLIVAAPELLEALQELLIRVADDEEYGPEHAITKARAAINKALGKG